MNYLHIERASNALNKRLWAQLERRLSFQVNLTKN